MRVTARLPNLDLINITMDVTMTLAEWKHLFHQLRSTPRMLNDQIATTVGNELYAQIEKLDPGFDTVDCAKS